MDDIVKQAMARWPNVPYCYGWLGLDRRGQWRLRNEYAQQNGLSGDPIRLPALVAFIERNYLRDESGAWVFQNGPQRVFVALDYTPWIVRLHGEALRTTTDRAFVPSACHVDEHGNVVLAGEVEGETGTHAALLHDHDLDGFTGLCQWHGEACGAELGRLRLPGLELPIEPIAADEVPRRYGFVRQPAPAPQAG